jgi:hypothetical protein
MFYATKFALELLPLDLLLQCRKKLCRFLLLFHSIFGVLCSMANYWGSVDYLEPFNRTMPIMDLLQNQICLYDFTNNTCLCKMNDLFAFSLREYLLINHSSEKHPELNLQSGLVFLSIQKKSPPC